MEKYQLLRERLATTLAGSEARFLVPSAATDEQLLRVHEAAYVESVAHGRLRPEQVRRIGFPWSLELVERSRRSVGGTIAAAHAALEDGAAVNLAGGTHHAFAGHGEGFCVFNDVAVAIHDLRAKGRVRRAAVIDLDVHQGNGTATVFADDPLVFTLSVHGASNYPFHKSQSSWDEALEDGAGDDAFLAAVHRGLDRAVTAVDPELLLYVAGADAFAGDRLGRLSVSKAGLAERDRMVFAAAAEHDLPVAVVMAGGYAADVNDTVDIHHRTVTAAWDYSKTTQSRSGANV